MAHDIVIKNGTIIDGTGTTGVVGDVGISGEIIAEIGNIDATGCSAIIDAEGKIVTPGFVDIHSHLDAQIGWDPLMSSSCWHGITSTAMGNCGMTFAPVRDGEADVLARAMESVEDIPAASILSGISWDWSTFGEYLECIDTLPKGINAGGYVGDVALRLFVAGDASCDPDYTLSESELTAMAQLVDDALEAGALGFSISRSLFHRVPDGRNVPGTWADPTEFVRTAMPLREHGRGILECAPRYNEEEGNVSRVGEELAWMAHISAELGRPFTFNLQQIAGLGDHYREVMTRATEANNNGSQLHPQITPRSVGVLFSLAANTLIDDLEAFQRVSHLDLSGRLAAIRDPDVRAAIINQGKDKPVAPFEKMFVMPFAQARYDYTEDDSIAAYARSRGVSCVEAYLDVLNESDGAAIINWPVMNNDENAIAEMLTSDVTVIGLADAGAHATQIMDASQPTYILSHWVREKNLISAERAVQMVTSETADLIGFTRRGRLAVGNYADVNIINFDELSLELPTIVNDFPNDAKRFVQKAHGFDYTIVNGSVFMKDGEHTGALCGKTLRSTDA